MDITARQWLAEHFEPLWCVRGEGDTLRVEARACNGMSERSPRVSADGAVHLAPLSDGSFGFVIMTYGRHMIRARLRWPHYERVARARAIERLEEVGEL